MFDEEYYLKNYPEVKKSGINPLLQYITTRLYRRQKSK